MHALRMVCETVHCQNVELWVNHTIMSSYTVCFLCVCFLPLSSLEREIKKESFMPTTVRGRQTNRRTESTLPHTGRGGGERERKQCTKRKWFQKVCQVHLPFHSINTSENEHLAEVWVCSYLGPSSFWLPSVHLAALNVISIFKIHRLLFPFLWGGGGSGLLLTPQHGPAILCFRQPSQKQCVPLLGSLKRFWKIVVNR